MALPVTRSWQSCLSNNLFSSFPPASWSKGDYNVQPLHAKHSRVALWLV